MSCESQVFCLYVSRLFFFFKQKTAYEMRISDWSSDVCSSDLGTHEQDAARRDFTLNALYYDPLTEEVIDFHRGVADLKNRTVRIIGDPETRYREDPVRMLSALRSEAKLSGTVAPSSRAPIKSMANLIEQIGRAHV